MTPECRQLPRRARLDDAQRRVTGVYRLTAGDPEGAARRFGRPSLRP